MRQDSVLGAAAMLTAACGVRGGGSTGDRRGPDAVQPLRDARSANRCTRRPTRRRARTRGCSTTSDVCATRRRSEQRRAPRLVPRRGRRRLDRRRRGVFVASPSIRTPMGGGMLAYRDPAAAGSRGRTAHRPRRPIDRRDRSRKEQSTVTSLPRDSHRTARRGRGPRRLSTQLPLWQMTMRAPQYPKGLRLYAYGTGMDGDLSELNILNHYIGMPPIEAPALETSMFPIGIGLLVVLCLAAPAHRGCAALAVAAAALMPIVILADLQWRLYEFGHSLNPTAPIRLKPFTPLVIGQTQWATSCPRHDLVGRRLPDRGGPSALGRRTHEPRATQAARRRGRRAGRRQRSPPCCRHRPRRAPAGAGVRAQLASSRPASTRRRAAARWSSPAGIYAGPDRDPRSAVGHRGARRDHRRRRRRQRRHDRGRRRGVSRVHRAQQRPRGDGGSRRHHRHRQPAPHRRRTTCTMSTSASTSAAAADVVVQDNTIAPGMHARRAARPRHQRLEHARQRRSCATGSRTRATASTCRSRTASSSPATWSRSCRYGLHSMYSQDAPFEDNDATGNLLARR